MQQKITNPKTIIFTGAFLLLFFALTATQSNAMVNGHPYHFQPDVQRQQIVKLVRRFWPT